MINHDELLRELRGIWEIELSNSHVSGYWTKDDALIDLVDLQTNGDSVKENQPYLDTSSTNTVIRNKGDESYYKLEKFENSRMILTCFFKNKEMQEHMRLAIFNLRKK